MDLHKKIQEINNRWDIPDDLPYEERFEKFKIRVLNIFSKIEAEISFGDVRAFCNALGVIYCGFDNIKRVLLQETDLRQLCKQIEIIFALPWRINKELLLQELSDALKFSNIGVSVTSKDGEVILYPSGEELLDKELVNGVLSFLSDKPKQHFIAALKAYEENTPQSRVTSADELRRTLEEFLKLKLNNETGLDENIKVLGKQLKELGVNNELRHLVMELLHELVMKLLNKLDTFFNPNSKHGDGDISEVENEFLIYQVALLMRYVHKII